MLVRVVYKGNVTEVMIHEGGVVADAVIAAGVVGSSGRYKVTNIPVCSITPLREGDVLEVI